MALSATYLGEAVNPTTTAGLQSRLFVADVTVGDASVDFSSGYVDLADTAILSGLPIGRVTDVGSVSHRSSAGSVRGNSLVGFDPVNQRLFLFKAATRPLVAAFGLSVGNAALAVETVLGTTTINADLFTISGSQLLVRAWGTVSNSVNADKIIRVRFGGLAGFSAMGAYVFVDTVALSWHAEATFLCVSGGAAQTATSTVRESTAAGASGKVVVNVDTTGAVDCTASQTLVVTGTGTSANDVLLKGWTVDYTESATSPGPYVVMRADLDVSDGDILRVLFLGS